MKQTLLIVTLFGCVAAQAQKNRWFVEAGAVVNSPKLIRDQLETNPQNFVANTSQSIKTGFYINAVNAPNYVFQHAFNFSRIAIGGTHSFQVLPSSTQNYPIPANMEQSYYRNASQFSYQVRTSIPGFIHKYVKRNKENYSKKWDVLLGVGLGFTTFNRENFDDGARLTNVRQTINQGAQTGVAFTSMSSIGSIRLHAPISLNATYAVSPRLNIRIHYDLLLPIPWMGTRNTITASNVYVFNNQVVASMGYSEAATRHQAGVGIQYLFFQKR